MSDVCPRVVVSRCLGFAAVRYDGQVLHSRFVEALRDHVEFVQVCPEVGMGLGVPRDPIRIEVTAGDTRLVQPSTGRDLTDAMQDFAESFLDGVGEVDGFILKAKSPSCGITDTKRFEPGAEEPLDDLGAGLFARAVLERFPHAAVEDEARLADSRHRHRFLTRLWAVARRREGLSGESDAAALGGAEPYPPALRKTSPEDPGSHPHP